MAHESWHAVVNVIMFMSVYVKQQILPAQLAVSEQVRNDPWQAPAGVQVGDVRAVQQTSPAAQGAPEQMTPPSVLAAAASAAVPLSAGLLFDELLLHAVATTTLIERPKRTILRRMETSVSSGPKLTQGDFSDESVFDGRTQDSAMGMRIRSRRALASHLESESSAHSAHSRVPTMTLAAI